jgi:hypothetical protein
MRATAMPKLAANLLRLAAKHWFEWANGAENKLYFRLLWIGSLESADE